MIETKSRYGLCFLAAAALHLAMPAGAGAIGNAQWTVDFGDDGSTWARDRECDDPVPGTYMSRTLLEEDRGRDATDCRQLHEAGLIRLFGVDPVSGRVDFGDDSSEYAHDRECDDIRFSGRGMVGTLLEEDRGRDATDCRRLYEAGLIRLFGVRGGGRRCRRAVRGSGCAQCARPGGRDDPDHHRIGAVAGNRRGRRGAVAVDSHD